MSDTASTSLFLALPRELRDEIFAHLALPGRAFTSSPKPKTHSFHRSTKIPETYVDSRIYLPVCPPNNILHSCRQLREECLDYYTHRFIAVVPTTIIDPTPAEETESDQLAARSNSGYEERVERSVDDGSVRISIELMRSIQATLGSFFPERKELSPRFLVLKPLLGRLKKIKLVVWAGYDWWRASRPRDMGATRARKTSNQTTQREGESTDIPKAEPLNKLSVAIGILLEHLPNIEELNIDVRIHAAEYWNWDLPEERWECLQSWLESPIRFQGESRLKRVNRNLICQWEPPHSFKFYRQVETLQEGGQPWHFERGYRAVPMDPAEQIDLPKELALTESFDRSE